MPCLIVNLDDPGDCRRAIRELRRFATAGRRQAAARGPACGSDRPGGGVAALPLRKKLGRIRQRGIWRHLLAMARLPEQSRSLMEWDAALGLPPNKMRSLKAIMAKLENRFAIRFLVAAGDAGHDDAGNPRYMIPPRVRSAILSVVAGEDAAAD